MPIAAGALAVVMIIEQRLSEPGADAASFTMRTQMIAAFVAVAVTTMLPDAAATLLDASPTARARRTGLRLSLVLLSWAVIWGLTLLLIDGVASGPVPATALTRQALVLLALSVGAAALRGPTAAAAVVALVVVGSLVVPDGWAILGDAPGTSWRLAAIASLGVGALAWAARDHARRHHTLGRIRAARGTVNRSKASRVVVF